MAESRRVRAARVRDYTNYRELLYSKDVHSFYDFYGKMIISCSECTKKDCKNSAPDKPGGCKEGIPQESVLEEINELPQSMKAIIGDK